MTSTRFWDFLTPPFFLSAKSVMFIRKFRAFLDPSPPSVRSSYKETPFNSFPIPEFLIKKERRRGTLPPKD